MAHAGRANPLHGFYRPFFDSRTGQIIALSAPGDEVRDALAASRIARLFPLPRYNALRLEPARPGIRPDANVIVVGACWVLVSPDKYRCHGRPKPLGVYPRLGQRLRRIESDCCFRFQVNDGVPRALVNRLTRRVYSARRRDDNGHEVDYGVLRRVLRGPAENTIIVEGIHRLGTMGVAKVATDAPLLEDVFRKLEKIDDLDESMPLEILIETTFDPSLSDGLYEFGAMTAVPLTLVYNGRWALDLTQDNRWVDLEPYDIELAMHSAEPARFIAANSHELPLPRLELRADLRDLDELTRRLCRSLLHRRSKGEKPADREAERERLLEAITAHADLFDIELVERVSWGSVKATRLPQGASSIRDLRKKFVVHMAICRLIGRRFHCREEYLRHFFPEFDNGTSDRPFVSRFTSSVTGKLRQGFRPLFVDRQGDKHYLRFEYDRAHKTYELRLERMTLVIKLRV
ncbi:MAG: hypothetical protein JSV80_05705 [Acidobacteriota bacterium]|nr:MAG: hypothetical protein JSV80_05705 [Acidobacteriota bacterium]